MTSDSSSNGRGSGRGGRSSSIIAGRRPARPKDDGAEAKDAKPDTKAPSRTSRRSTAKSDARTDRTTEERKAPARRRRRPATDRTSTPAAEADRQDETPELDTAEEAEQEVRAEQTAAATTTTVAPPAPAPTRAPSVTPAPPLPSDDELRNVRALIEEQRGTLAELKAGMLALEQQVQQSQAGILPRLGIFVDVPNLLYGQEPDEKPINVGKLLDYLGRGRQLIRATAYSPVSDDPGEPVEQQKFVAPFVPYEYRIVTKPLKRFADGSIKGNFDVEMAIDMITMADRLDVLCIVSGDADFARAVETVQARGLRVEVVAFIRSTSLEMRALADHYVELSRIIDQLR
ncbi:MAG: NYN domain-containing protein [Dehalococcoidia bacterium]|nr:NYN domain-containing protein [Dehalococcoidia bacterium]